MRIMMEGHCVEDSKNRVMRIKACHKQNGFLTGWVSTRLRFAVHRTVLLATAAASSLQRLPLSYDSPFIFVSFLVGSILLDQGTILHANFHFAPFRITLPHDKAISPIFFLGERFVFIVAFQRFICLAQFILSHRRSCSTRDFNKSCMQHACKYDGFATQLLSDAWPEFGPDVALLLTTTGS